MWIIRLALTTLLLVRASTAHSINPRITAGVDSERGTFPFIASISWEFPIFSPAKHFCGATIIHERWLLGSAFCVVHIPILGRTTIRVGKYYTASNDQYTRIYFIEKRILHEFFNGTRAPNDIMMLKTTKAIEFNEYVQKVKMPIANIDLCNIGIIVGWGSVSTTEHEVSPEVLQSGLVSIISNRLCERQILSIQEDIDLPRYIYHTQICTNSYDDFTSVCIGDGGGPLVQYRETDAELIGIISWGKFPCGVKKTPSVHTRVTSFLPWIEKQQLENP